jgi:hypothetical protein
MENGLSAARKRTSMAQAWVLFALVIGACNREAAKPGTETKPAMPTAVTASGAHAPVAAADPKRQRWDGVVAPAERWRKTVATDVLLVAGAPGLAPDAVDAEAKPLSAALRGIAGVDQVITRSRAGELRIVVRFGVTGNKGPAAVAALLAAWHAAAPTAFAPPRAEAIARGQRALAMLEMIAVGGRVEATRYVDMHPDALIQAAQTATRSHLAGAVRPLVAVRLAPASLQMHGIQLNDLVTALQGWLVKASASPTLPPLEEAKQELEEIKVKRHWTANGQELPAVALDRLVDVSVEQGEPTREARNGHLPMTLWFVDAAGAADPVDIDSAVRKVANDSKEVFRPSVQSLGGAYRFVVVAPEGDAQKTQNTLSERLKQLREHNESIVAINAIAGHDGVPEAVDVDAQSGRCWTVWISNAGPDVGAMVFAVRETLSADGWEVHALTNLTDTALAWVLGAWGAGGALISADDASVLAPEVGRLAQRALSGREKAGLRQGPQPNPPPLAFRRVDPKGLAGSKLAAADQQQFVDLLSGPQTLGWWHETPVWLSLPVGDLAATIGQMPLNWQASGGSGPQHGWIATDVLRIADTAPVVERVRVNGRSALWAVPEDFADAPDAVAESFWRMVEAAVELRVGMRVDPLETKQRPLVTETPGERPAP